MIFHERSADEIVAEIKEHIRDRGEYRVVIPHDETDIVGMHAQAESVRALGREAGRELSWKVRTYARYGEGGIWVWVVLKESNPVHQAMLRREGEKQLIAALNEIGRQVLTDP